MHGRALACVALAIPVLSGLGYLFAYEAPRSFVLINAAALTVSLLAIVLSPGISTRPARFGAILAALVMLFLPLATGPEVNGASRWLPLGPFPLHAGMLVVPALAVCSAEERAFAPGILSLALLAALLHPDMATGAALMLAAVGLYDATRDWRFGVVAIVAFAASLVAAMRGELPAQPFVERVIFLLARADPLAALGLLAALVAGFYLMVGGAAGTPAQRKALGGALFGFSFAGLVANYPSALIGYGAAPILGFGLALALLPPGRVLKHPR